MGAGVSCTPNPCPQPIDSGACCLPDGSCLESDSLHCDSIGGSWQGAGTDCDPNPCPQPQGACCMPDGTCFETVESQCASSGGTWMGAGVSCTPNPCPQASDSGACCLLSGGCVYTTLEDCRDMCGKWLGYGVPCLTTNCPDPDTISGLVVYVNVAQTPLGNIIVILTDTSRPHCSDTVISGSDGSFAFPAWPGDYQLTATTNRPWVYGASNAVDALKVARHFVGLDTLKGLKLVAGNVNAMLGVNTTDALQILQRFSGIISAFAAGDWTFGSYYLSTSTKTMHHLEAAIVGDVDASYVPVKSGPSALEMVYQSSVKGEGRQIEIPLYVDRDVTLSALSLELYYPAEVLDIREVDLQADEGVWVWNAEDGRLMLAWYTLGSVEWKKGDALLTLSLDVSDPSKLETGEWLSLGNLSEANDPEGKIQAFALITPQPIPGMDALYLGSNKPNPFTGQTEIDFAIPEEGRVRLEVFDALGRSVKVLADEWKNKGTYVLGFDCKLCQPGVYFYRLSYSGKEGTQVLSRRMIMTR